MEKNELGGTCSTYGERGGAYSFMVGKAEEKNHLEDAGIDGRIILIFILLM
jgi:hypothetical protein